MTSTELYQPGILNFYNENINQYYVALSNTHILLHSDNVLLIRDRLAIDVYKHDQIITFSRIIYP